MATTELATTNDALISTSKTFGEMLKDKRKPFEAMFQQVLLYSKFDFTLEDGMPEEYEDVFEECIEILDDVKYERDPKKRLCGVNELCCVLYPMFKDYIENQSKSKQSGKGKNLVPVLRKTILIARSKGRAMVRTSLRCLPVNWLKL